MLCEQDQVLQGAGCENSPCDSSRWALGSDEGEDAVYTGKEKGGDIRKHDQGTDFLLVGLDDL